MAGVRRVAWLNLRHNVKSRIEAFTRGLERLGYTVQPGVTTVPNVGDIFVTWNRIREGRLAAGAFESRGLPVLVAENATWGNSFMGGHWYTLASHYHNTAGCFPVVDRHRWDNLDVDLKPWRHPDGETVILPSRGIGPPGHAMPEGWGEDARKRFGGRLRPHPGQGTAIPLAEDLKSASRVVTWGSGAAVLALMWGVKVTSEMPHWIGEQDNTDQGRLEMFRQLAWAQWRLEEIASGEAFARLLVWP